MRTLIWALFPGTLLDNMMYFEAHWWNNEGDSLSHYHRETNVIVERLIAFDCGFCANANCSPVNGDLQDRSAYERHSDRWDHDEKKSKEVSKLRDCCLVYLLNEIGSWCEKLCGFCDSIRTDNQKNRGCARRCFDVTGTCSCKKFRGNTRYPTRVSI